MNDYGTYINNIDYNYLTDFEVVVHEQYHSVIREILNQCDEVSMDEWFGDKSIVEKSVPKFNFI